MGERIAITGLGVVSAAGMGVADALRTLRTATRPALVPCPVVELPVALPMFAVAGNFPSVDRTFHLAMAAVGQALADANLQTQPPNWRLGVCLGTTVACQLNDIPFYADYRTTGNPDLAAAERFALGGLAERVARKLHADGPTMTVVNACSSGTDALGVALAWLRSGCCDAVLAGGADELSAIPASGFYALGVTSSTPCQPFDRDRQGLNLGEGAGIVVLETEAGARRRNQPVALLATGFGSAADGYHLTAPHPDGIGLELAVRAALKDAEIQADEIDFVNAHGTATLENDRIEGTVLARLFGPAPRVVSTKGYTGHTLGAAGGVEAVFTALALREGWIPACLGFATRDPEIPFSPLTTTTPVTRQCALSTSLAFGGNNAAVVLARTGGRR